MSAIECSPKLFASLLSSSPPEGCWHPIVVLDDSDPLLEVFSQLYRTNLASHDQAHPALHVNAPTEAEVRNFYSRYVKPAMKQVAGQSEIQSYKNWVYYDYQACEAIGYDDSPVGIFVRKHLAEQAHRIVQSLYDYDLASWG